MKSRFKVAGLGLIVLGLVFFSGCSFLNSPELESEPEQNQEIDADQELPQNVEPDQEQNAEHESSPSAGGQCLVGNWQTVPGTISDYLSEAMNSTADGAITFGVEEIEGYLSLEFTADGEMLGQADEYQVRVTIEELGSEIDIIMSLSGAAEYAADGSTLTITDPDYDAVAAGDGLIAGIQTGEQVVRLDLEPGSFSVQGGPLAMSDEVESTNGTSYSCEGDTLTLDIPDFSSVDWVRVQ
jgi:hypothetical protein